LPLRFRRMPNDRPGSYVVLDLLKNGTGTVYPTILARGIWENPPPVEGMSVPEALRVGCALALRHKVEFYVRDWGCYWLDCYGMLVDDFVVRDHPMGKQPRAASRGRGCVLR